MTLTRQPASVIAQTLSDAHLACRDMGHHWRRVESLARLSAG